jgi:hypothetical protein
MDRVRHAVTPSLWSLLMVSTPPLDGVDPPASLESFMPLLFTKHK